MTNNQEAATQQPQEQENIDQQLAAAASTANQDTKGKKKERSVDVSGVKEAIVNYLVPIICVVISIVAGVFVLMPSYQSIPALSAELDENKRLEKTLQNKLNNLNRLLEFKGVVEENSDLVSRVLVSEELVPGLLTQIDKITRESGMSISNLNYGLGSSKKADGSDVEFNTVTVNLGATGSFAQLKSFMENVENAARIITVDNFRYANNKRDEGNMLSVNFVLISPYLYVESDAVTDEPVDLDISDQDFQTLINKIKGLKYYDPYEIDANVPVVENTEEEGTEGAEGEEEADAPADETADETATEVASEEETGDEVPAAEEESVFGN